MDTITAINKDQFDRNFFFWLAVGNVFLGYSELPKSETRHMWLCQENKPGVSVVWVRNPEHEECEHTQWHWNGSIPCTGQKVCDQCGKILKYQWEA